MKREFVLGASDSQMSATLKNAKDYILDSSLLYKPFGLCILLDRSLFPLTGTWELSSEKQRLFGFTVLEGSVHARLAGCLRSVMREYITVRTMLEDKLLLAGKWKRNMESRSLVSPVRMCLQGPGILVSCARSYTLKALIFLSLYFMGSEGDLRTRLWFCMFASLFLS